MPHVHSAERLTKTQECIYTLIDYSGSMFDTDYKPSRQQGAIEANRRFIDAKASQFPDDQIGIIGFNEGAYLLQSAMAAGAGRQSLRDSLADDIPGAGSTNFTYALELAEELLLGTRSRRSGGSVSRFLRSLFDKPSCTTTRRIILLTDGQDSGGNSVAVAGRLKKAGVVIECIGIAGNRSDVGEDILKRIASKDQAGKPRYYFIGDTTTLIKKYKTMANQLKAL
jgi:hypothetical protein